MKQTRWIVSAAVAVLATAGVVLPSLAGDETPQPVPAATKAVKLQTTCPVMGGAVNTNIFVDADGKRIYLCCNGCIDAVKKEPSKYIKKLEAEGITLDKTPQTAMTNAPAATPR